jgi:NADPH-dependent 7-cyano-7-deazaguanine reductase QueF
MSPERVEIFREARDVHDEATCLIMMFLDQRNDPPTVEMVTTYRRRAAAIREALDRLDKTIDQLGDLT